jgi:HK97 family phage prohead protease
MEAVTTLSIGFAIKDYRNDISQDDDGHRILKNIDLWEVSLVSLPANPQAQVTAVKHGMDADARDLMRSIAPLTDSLIREIVR